MTDLAHSYNHSKPLLTSRTEIDRSRYILHAPLRTLTIFLTITIRALIEILGILPGPLCRLQLELPDHSQLLDAHDDEAAVFR